LEDLFFHDIAQAHTLLQLFLLGSHFHPYRQFQADCQTGQLPAYSFIEPQYFADFGHPENDRTLADELTDPEAKRKMLKIAGGL